VLRLRDGAVAVAAVVLLSGVAGCEDVTTESDSPPGSGGGAALAAVDSLTVKGRAPRTGYERSRFGTAWADTDSNACDTRVISMLRRVTEAFAQLTQEVVCCAY
jgi:hypothetical protein